MRLLSLILVTFCLHMPVAIAERVAQEPVVFSSSLIKPWTLMKDGQKVGLLDRTLAVLGEYTGHPYRNMHHPYSRVFHDLYSGTADMALVFDAPEIEELAVKVGILETTRVIVVGRPGALSIESLKDLRGLNVGHMRASKFGPEFDDAVHFERHPMNSVRQGLAMVISGRIDAMAAVDHTIYWGMREIQLEPGRLVEILEFDGPDLGLFMSKKSKRQNLIDDYREAIEALKSSGAFSEIYGGAYRWAETGDRASSSLEHD